ncbi:hypothetical protein RJ640_008548 [Escallonia rubra]|uniref:Auxin-responsive protein n=1 Tax=Escallonia rubra TaxID=112253 RepID=A0AA88QT70_9ASTE|nr:hypothetical protein RJ640_008548 [Escallonia rubra]
MEGYSPQLLDLIPKERKWLVQRDEEEGKHGASEEKKLELRLGPPGQEEDWTRKNNSTRRINDERSLFSLGYFPNVGQNTTNTNSFMIQAQKAQFQLQPTTTPQGLSVMGKESSQSCSTKVADLQNAAEKKIAFSPAPAANTAVPNSSQKRTAPGPVVGWPPIRSFRKNLAGTSSSKLQPESQSVVPNKVSSENPVDSCPKGLFVKINMDGVPIGRKVDLKAYESYDKLASAVDELFRSLLAAQMDSSAGRIQNKQESEKAITGLLDGSGEYTLVYEDNEGDRMLVGDVPWHMFVSTVKRLRVLKSSELSRLRLNSKQEKVPLDVDMR